MAGLGGKVLVTSDDMDADVAQELVAGLRDWFHGDTNIAVINAPCHALWIKDDGTTQWLCGHEHGAAPSPEDRLTL